MRRRRGFTLVELLVAMALILFIMAILSQAFVSATNTFRNLKAVGDMAQKLRATTQLLQRDLAADHFEGKKRLSDSFFGEGSLWLFGAPPQGFFQIYHGSAPSPVPGSPCFVEGADVNGNLSYRTVDQTMAFTIKLRGNQMGDFLTAGAPPQLLAASGAFGPPEARYQSSSYSYQWAEVAWFLRPSINPATGQQDTTAVDQLTNSPGVPLYTLYRRQRLAVPDNSLVPPIPAGQLASCLELSCWPNGGNLYFNNPTDLTVPQRRFGGGVPTNFTTLAQDLANLQAVNPALAGSDIQLTDVVSFDVRVTTSLTANLFLYNDPFVSLFDPFFLVPFFQNGNTLFGGAMVFDTWSTVVDGLSDYSQALQFVGSGGFGQPSVNPNLVIPMWDGGSGPVVVAIKVTVRIWDPKTNQTRQVTIVQAM